MGKDVVFSGCIQPLATWLVDVYGLEHFILNARSFMSVIAQIKSEKVYFFTHDLHSCGKKEFMCCKFNASGDLITAGGTDGSITVSVGMQLYFCLFVCLFFWRGSPT